MHERPPVTWERLSAPAVAFSPPSPSVTSGAAGKVPGTLYVSVNRPENGGPCRICASSQSLSCSELISVFKPPDAHWVVRPPTSERCASTAPPCWELFRKRLPEDYTLLNKWAGLDYKRRQLFLFSFPSLTAIVMALRTRTPRFEKRGEGGSPLSVAPANLLMNLSVAYGGRNSHPTSNSK